MASPQIVNNPAPPPASGIHHIQKRNPPLLQEPAKMGFMGEQGVGKTSTAALLSMGLSAEFHNRAPVWVTDPEDGWKFMRPMFAIERIPLEIHKVPTFKGMLQDMRDAERAGACVWNVELGKIWTEILRTLQKKNPVSWGSELNYMWTDFVNQFLNSKLHCMVLGRIQDIVEDFLDEEGKQGRIKVGEGMRAGGQRNNFGYEPHCVVRMTLEVKPRVKKGKTFEDEGRYVHRAKVAKDRTWALNGKCFRFADRDCYKAGDYKYVLDAFRPHILALQDAGSTAPLDTLASSESLLDPNGNGEYYRERERKNAIAAEISGCLDLSFGGRAKDDVQIRLAVCEVIFGVKSKEAREQLTLDQLERGLRILQIYETYSEHKFDSKEAILKQIGEAIVEYDAGTAELPDIPF